MKKKLLLTGALAAILAIGVVTTVSIVNDSYDMVSSLNNTTQTYIILDNTNQPTIMSGKATQTIGVTTIEYFGVTDYADGHVTLNEGGQIRKSDASNSLSSITVTFSSGALRVFSSFEEDRINYVYDLVSATPQPIRGNYFKIVAREDTNIESIDVEYGCEDTQKTTTYEGKDFFDGNNWYTAEQSGTTEAGTPIGDRMINSDGHLVFHRDTSDKSNQTLSHIKLFQTTDDFYMYNTNQNAGMYKPFKNDMAQFNLYNGVQYNYRFKIKCLHSFHLMVGGAVQAWLEPGDGSGSNAGRYLATYVRFDYSQVVKITQGSTDSNYRSKDAIQAPATSLFKFNDTFNDVMFSFIRTNDPVNPTKANDKLIMKVYINGTHLVFANSGSNTKVTVNDSGDYVFTERLFDTTNYGPYFGVQSVSSDSSYDVIISDFSWDRYENPSSTTYARLDANTYVTSNGGQGNTNFNGQQTAKGYRYGSYNYDDHLRWDMADIIADYTAKIAIDPSLAETATLRLRLKSAVTYPNLTALETMKVRVLDLANYSGDVSWDPAAETWNKRTTGIKHDNMRPHANASDSIDNTYTYDSRTGIIEVSFLYSAIIDDIDEATSLMTILVEGRSANFQLEYYSLFANEPSFGPVLYITY